MSCPICDKESSEKFRPFCSVRCADIDLGRWMMGSYAIATDEAPELEDLGTDSPDQSKKLH